MLFLCADNAGRSQIAASLTDRYAHATPARYWPASGTWTGIPDPAGKDLLDVRAIRDDADARVRALVDELTTSNGDRA